MKPPRCRECGARHRLSCADLQALATSIARLHTAAREAAALLAGRDDGVAVDPDLGPDAMRWTPPTDTRPSITCPDCGRTSYHPEDVRWGYCSACSWWTSYPPLAAANPDPGRGLRDDC